MVAMLKLILFPLGDDDEVIVIPPEDKTVCYGRLDKTKVQAHMIPNPSLKVTFYGKAWWPPMTIALKRLPGKDNIIRVVDPTGKDFGNIDVKTALGLARILDTPKPKFRAQARLSGRAKKPTEYPGQPCSSYLDATINLYGPKSQVKMIGAWLSQRQMFLRDPLDYERSYELCNPHALKPGPVLPRTSGAVHSRETGYVYRTVEETRSEVLGMFDSLQKSENLPELEPDERITTNLLMHQKQGLHFMTQREQERIFSDTEEHNNSLWRLKVKPNGQRVYYNIITGREEHQKPPEVLGGILADMMGLGKTLSILALVVGSLETSHHWATLSPAEPEDDQQMPPVRNTKSTLLIAPLSTLNNWEEQIANHVKKGALSYYLYHGNHRSTDLDELAQYDMIITTYSIVASEYKGRGRKRIVSPLYQLNFFRIVLDEAHMIREQSTLQSQATCQLSAQRRWAVTGTPVQNRLDDLGALIKFLRIKPFDKSGFTQFILMPFKNADPEILPKLRLLVDSITLRRLKDRIDLPPRHDHIVRLRFSEEEAKLYDWFMKFAHQKVKTLTGGEKQSLGGRSYVHILQAIMRLRLICAHGRELLTEDDLKMTEGFTAKNAITLDDEDDDKPTVMHPRQVYEMMMLFKETDQDSCVACAKKIAFSDDDGTPSPKDSVLGYMLPCFQLVCKDCMKNVQSIIDQKSVNDRFPCSFCNQWVRGSPYQLTQEEMDAAEEARERARDNPRHSKIMSRYGGPHTKTRTLISDLLQSKTESQKLPHGEPPIKSVVFSGWTTHLDLIQIALDEAELKYVRLDGKMSRLKRNASLDAFRDDPEITIILISLTAGGLGLNLTSGSKVYVMEPQFNPAAEAQAVDRVHRLGQKREVTTTRYIMENSFEENMLKLQQKKQNLADLSMSRGKLDKTEAAKHRMEELRSLFR